VTSTLEPVDGTYPPEKILTENTETVDIDSLKPYRKNPRVGDVKAIADSLEKNGQFRPVVVQRSTGEILGGNHTWKAARSLGWKKISVVFVDVDDTAAKRIVLADNRTNDLATYDTAILQDIISGLPDPSKGTGYDDNAVASLLEGMQQQNQQMVEDVLRPPITTSPLLDTEFGESDNSVGSGKWDSSGFSDEDFDVTSSSVFGKQDDDDIETLDDELGELQGILQLKEDMVFASDNYYDIPVLAKSMLLDKLPDPLDTWGGKDATPDDGVTTWLWNYGVASKSELPMDRAILCFYTYDTYFETFWENPGFMTAKMLNAGIKTAVVPDFSYYSDMSCATWIMNQFRAQWLGRYFQEAGIKVIPRIQFAIDAPNSRSLDFNTMGIPKGSPIVAKSTQNSNSKEEFDLEVAGLRVSLEKVEAKTLLMYGGGPAKRVIEALDPVGKGLVENVVRLDNYAAKRRGVVYDKKEGLAAKNKDKKRMARDKAETGMAVGKKSNQDAVKAQAAEENDAEL
jgi:hypothetical protein